MEGWLLDDYPPKTFVPAVKAAADDCDRWVSGRKAPVPDRLRQLAEAATEEQDATGYGSGGEVVRWSRRWPSCWASRRPCSCRPGSWPSRVSCGCTPIARGHTAGWRVHGLSHFLVHELNALEEVHGLRIERLTSEPRQPRPDELAAIPGKLAAVTLELPLRDAGFVLPTWDELVVFAEACAERGVPLHLDGARLWESTPYLEHSLAEVAALASTVYVSFYKGLGGLSGAAWLGRRT